MTQSTEFPLFLSFAQLLPFAYFFPVKLTVNISFQFTTYLSKNVNPKSSQHEETMLPGNIIIQKKRNINIPESLGLLSQILTQIRKPTQIKTKVGRRKKIMKIKVEVNEIHNTEKINETKQDSFSLYNRQASSWLISKDKERRTKLYTSGL